jgi:tripartite-type tricarboxylate transporter receptor subunit TctC
MRLLMRLLGIAAIPAVAALYPSTCFADSWPQRPVRLIVPVGAGTAPDIVARLFAARLAGRWKQPVIVDNRPGADGVVGVAAFVSSRDDHALLFSFSGAMTILPLVQEKPRYNPSRDLVPIVSAADSFVSVAAAISTKINSLAELVANARAHPRKLSYNSSAGALPYLFSGFLKAVQVDMVLVPYRELNLAVNDLAEGRLQIMISSMAAIRSAVQTGKVRYLAVTNKVRAPVAPNVPTAAEAGYPGLTYEGLLGFYGARDIPVERQDRIVAAVRELAADPVIANRLTTVGMVARVNGPAEFSTALAEERARMEGIVKLIGNTPDR